MKSAGEISGFFLDKFIKSRVYWVSAIYALAVIAGYVCSFAIRFDFYIPDSDLLVMYSTLPYLVIARMTMYIYFNNIYVSFRHSGLRDFWDLFKAQVFGTVLFLTILFFLRYLDGFSRSIFIIEFLLTISMIIGVHFLRKFLLQLKEIRLETPKRSVLIVGAGNAGVIILNEFKQNDRLGVSVVGFVDDDPYKLKTYVQGIPVLGKTTDLSDLVKKHSIDEVIIAIPSAPYREAMRIARLVSDLPVNVKILPGLDRLVEDGAYLGQLNHVLVDQLIGRKIVRFSRESDRKQIENDIKGKVVLVSGAGGSIGSEICTQVMDYRPKKLIALERHENSLFELELIIRREYPSLDFVPIIGDICNEKKLEKLFAAYPVDIVYHAAAYKHVPMMEREVDEAIRNNVMGTWQLANWASASKVKKFILISTDKAVNPTNIMGTTKRVAELIMQSKNFTKPEGGTRFVSVRFGNVLESNGSVIPVFKKQIAQGGPVTVTHEDVSRYFMAIPEAVQLVMTAGSMGKGGEIFLLDMGQPVRILDLAYKLIRQAGFEPNRDVEIVFTGLRPGEKLHEELYWEGEGVVKTENKKITMLCPGWNPGKNQVLMSFLSRLKEGIEDDWEDDRLIGMLKEIVPESSIEAKGAAPRSSRGEGIQAG